MTRHQKNTRRQMLKIQRDRARAALKWAEDELAKLEFVREEKGDEAARISFYDGREGQSVEIP